MDDRKSTLSDASALKRGAPGPEPGSPTLIARNIHKRFGSVVALSGASLTLHPGECVGLVGDNGAGKSTLVKIISGALQPDEGELLLTNDLVRFRSPLDARRAGIETVYQTLALAPTLNAPTNVFLGRELLQPGLPGRLGFVDRGAMRERTRELLRVLNVTLRSLEYPVGSLSGGQRQAVAIARAIAWEQLVLILDEPTAALGARQTRLVMDLLRQLRIEHPLLAILLITHDLPRLHEVTDRVVVMRQGTVVADFKTKETNEHMLVTTMMGVAS